MYHSHACNPGDIPSRPDDGIVDREPEIPPLQPVLPDEFRHGTIAPHPLVSVRTQKENIVVLRKQTIHERIQLFGVSSDIPLLKGSQCG